MAVEASFLRELLGLRGLLDQAIATAKVPGEVRRTTSVVLMDAANERTLHMAAVKLGVASKRADFEQLLSGVKGALVEWAPNELSSIRKLHRMRNLVQHEGVGADRADIEAWVISTEVFVRELVLAAFGLSLDSVALADAIVDESMRTHITAAQEALDRGDFAASMGSSGRAFSKASSKWLDLVASKSGHVPLKPVSRNIVDTQGFEYLEKRIEQAETIANLTPPGR